MSDRAKETILGVFLLMLASIWTAVVMMTIPPGPGGGDIGPRAFPLGFGVILMGLSAILLLKCLACPPGPENELVVKGRKITNTLPIHWLPALLLLAEVFLYGFLLQKVGFVLATPVVMLLVMVVNYQVRSWRKLLGMAIGMTFGCWLIFGKLLGIYLARGQWINLG